MRVENPLSAFDRSILKKVRLWKKSRRLARFKRMPKIFIPTPSRWQIVVPYKPIGVALIVVLAGLCIYLVFRSDLLLVREISVRRLDGETVTQFVSDEQVRDILSAYLARSIVFLDSKKIAESLKKQFLPIAEVKVEKQLPDKLVVQVKEREPVAVLVVSRENGIKGEKDVKEKYLVDKMGFVFAKCPRGVTLPELQIEGLQPLKRGEVPESAEKLELGDTIEGSLVTAALHVINGFAKIEGLQPTAVKIQNQNEIRVDTNKDFFVIFTIEKEINEQILALKQIFENAKHQGKALKKVDLRFKLPVVLY